MSNCKSCKHAKMRKNGALECHRNPPTLLGAPVGADSKGNINWSFLAGWPQVPPDETCSEFVTDPAIGIRQI